MKDHTNPKEAISLILIGSNISPEANINAAISKLHLYIQINAISSTWETAAIGTRSPNFLNLAIQATVNLQVNALKYDILRRIEMELGRVRTGDKYAPRPMDLDIITYNGEVIDLDVWERAFIALPISELMPDLVHPQTHETIQQIAKRLQNETFAVVRPDLKFRL